MKVFKVLCILVLMATLTSYAFAEEARRSARVIDFEGNAEIKIKGEGWKPLEAGSILNEGDVIRTRSGSTAILNLNGNGETATVEVEENSQLMLSELITNREDGTEKTLLDLAIGKILIKAKKLHTTESRFEVKTPTSIVGVRGTEFVVQVEALE